jgi:predicted Rossmann-fold nucleotide-binding protein
MESYITIAHYDLTTPDGVIVNIAEDKKHWKASIFIDQISRHFVGFSIDKDQIFFNLKSTLAQLGLESTTKEIYLNPSKGSAEVLIHLHALTPIAEQILPLLTQGMQIGKLFAHDPERRVRDPDYLFRMFARCDIHGRPLLSLGGFQEKEKIILEKIEGRTVAFLPLKKGTISYESSIYGLLPTLCKALKHSDISTRGLIQLHQILIENTPRDLEEGFLLVKTAPLHVRTVFARVVDEQLPFGYKHTAASILQPDTMASGDIYELYGSSPSPINCIPLEFYTLEPHREHVFFEDRDQLQASLDDPEVMFKAFESAPKDHPCAVFVVKGELLSNLKKEDWISKDPEKHPFPGLDHPSRQIHLVEKYIENQPSYPFLKAVENELITSQGILLSKYFPTPLLKRLLLSDRVLTCLKQIYFQYPSKEHGEFFSHEDRSLMLDLAKFAVPLFWVDPKTKEILKYVLKPGRDVGMFVPLKHTETFIHSTMFGVYGSNLIEGDFDKELEDLLRGVLDLKDQVNHPLLNPKTPISLVTGGGPGAMETGNRIAKKLGILSCANLVDFRLKEKSPVNEQKQNPFVESKMTYHLDRLVERQAEFYLDLPLFLIGGIGTDFEFSLEEVRRKVGAQPPTPILLFGPVSYWEKKITTRFQCNLDSGTIKGSEWVSNCFYCVQNARQGLEVYKRFFKGLLPIGKEHPHCDLGFFPVPENW